MNTSRGSDELWTSCAIRGFSPRVRVDPYGQIGRMADDGRKELSPFAPVEIPTLTRRLVDASLTISDLSPERPEFLHAVLCQLGLPRSRQNTRRRQYAS